MIDRNKLQSALQEPYDRDLFAKKVLSPVFGSCFSLYGRPVSPSSQPSASERTVIDDVSIYGSIKLEGNTEIVCYEIVLQPEVRIERSKVTIQHYVRKLLTAGDGVLVNFVSPQNKEVWRLTLVAKDSEFIEGSTKEKITHSKRYTYLLGPNETCRTAAERFETLCAEKPISFDALVNAFSVEKLSKAFFDEYNLHYDNFIAYLNQPDFKISVFNGDEKAIRDFTQKMLGRIVFLYFVQKKGWLGASDTRYKDGKPDFMKLLFKSSRDNKKFYSWLATLFFETLNKERPHDDFEMPNGEKLKVPFLNGGLFDREAHDESFLTFSPTLFYNPGAKEEILTKKNKNNSRGFLDFLDAFNFTVHEDSPDDHTVAVDPEMLGHIFENLLEDNKDKGAFYTPKKIVHYMCQESLTEYLTAHLSKEYTVYRQIDNKQAEIFGNDMRQGQLKTALQLGDKALNRDALAYIVKHKDVTPPPPPPGHSLTLTPAQLKRIDSLLTAVKICDPAIGSGAFPMGLLQGIFAVKEAIAYKLGTEWKPAEVKENIIQNSIYGADIEKGAVDIARLRFWLSLVVDEEKPRALPNLDYKIMQGNSLLESYGDIDLCVKITEEKKLLRDENKFTVADIRKLKETVKKYFKAGNSQLKKELQNNIESIVNKFIAERINEKIKYNNDALAEIQKLIISSSLLKPNTTASARKNEEALRKHKATLEQLLKEGQRLSDIKARLKQIQKTKTNPYFLWHLWFSDIFDNGGFDIVIGNPPYIQLQKNVGSLAKQYEKVGYQTFERMGDIYSLFYERAWQILKPKGTLCFITSNKWMRAGYGESTRKFFAEKTNPILLIDFAGQKIFEAATVDTNILMFAKDKNQQRTKACLVKGNPLNDLSAFVKQFAINCSFSNGESWVMLSPIEQQIKEKIERIGTPLKNWDIQINYGIKTGYNEAFIIDGKKRKELIEQNPKSSDIIRPILRGRDIKRYGYEFADKYLIATFPALKIDIEQYPAVKQHLLSFGYGRLKQTGDEGARKKTNNKWFETQDSISYWEDFSKPKITYIEIMTDNPDNGHDFPCFSFDTENCVVLNTAYIMTGNVDELKYILGVLNSKLGRLLVKNYVVQLQPRGFRMLNQCVVNFPIPKLNLTEIKELSALVDRILKFKRQAIDIQQLRQEIDGRVYKYYNFDEKEIEFIESL